MAENERMMKEMEEKWEEKLAAAEKENKVKQLQIVLIIMISFCQCLSVYVVCRRSKLLYLLREVLTDITK